PVPPGIPTSTSEQKGCLTICNIFSFLSQNKTRPLLIPTGSVVTHLSLKPKSFLTVLTKSFCFLDSDKKEARALHRKTPPVWEFRAGSAFNRRGKQAQGEFQPGRVRDLYYWRRLWDSCSKSCVLSSTMADGVPRVNLQSSFDEAWTMTRPMGSGPPPEFSGPSQTPVTPPPMPQGTAILGGGAGTSREHEAQEAVPTVVPAPLQAGPVVMQQTGPTWLSNTVMVSKAGGKWRMCIDFRDLNKACPKDLYLLPRIDQLVDSTAGCELLSLMDASQGYHQIPLAKEDWKRVSFITSKGTYCYVVMPFGLKNAGATYQRLVDQIFKDQLGRNMEVYVDDMLVKSKMEADHVGDLRETFQTLRKYGMKLNPAKCSFGVKAGKFLGYMVTKRGIEVNPEKVRAVVEMKPPASVKEVQILTGRIAGLSRFISKVAEKSSPLFKTLKKSSKFQWTEEAQKAFEELQRTLANLPLLAKPIHGEELVLYISVGESVVSSVLLREEGVAQFPIYYVSRVMQGAELRYSEIEKCALAVVVTVRKLRPYFLNHKVKVRTNMPLEQTLGRPAVSGRLVKWAVKLSEYSIIYEPRRAINAQVLADFIQEGTKEEEDGGGMWQLFADGSVSRSGAGLGIVLISPKRDYLEFAVKMGFRVSNNEAEYEAVTKGLQLALAGGARKIQVHSDSQL
ncbi:Unknown protein, partial [Striga hermonthica]